MCASLLFVASCSHTRRTLESAAAHGGLHWHSMCCPCSEYHVRSPVVDVVVDDDNVVVVAVVVDGLTEMWLRCH